MASITCRADRRSTNVSGASTNGAERTGRENRNRLGTNLSSTIDVVSSLRRSRRASPVESFATMLGSLCNGRSFGSIAQRSICLWRAVFRRRRRGLTGADRIPARSLLGVALCGTALFTCPALAQSPVSPVEVAVRNGRLTKDGLAWSPHGFHQIAFVAPPGAANTKPFFVIAAQNYSPQEYGEMRAAGADSVRIQVSQPGMDRQNPLSTPLFRDRVLGAVRAARAAGLIVIISMQDEPQSGDTHSSDLPDGATRRAWVVPAQAFGQDRGVLFELFNEPRPAPSRQNWTAWADAMNETIKHVRSTGARNVVIADGLDYAEQLDGAPRLSDPLEQVAYAAHPYVHSDSDQKETAWQVRFGDFAKTAPVIVTEWSTAYYCNGRTPKAAVKFLQYLQGQGIGLEAATWDWQPAKFASAIYDFPQGKFSTFVGPSGQLSCSDAGFGFGKTVELWYRTGVPPGSPQ